MLRVLLLFSTLSFVVSTKQTADCSTSFDCGLSGDCVNGTCICDAGWKGTYCTVLDLLPTPKNAGFSYTTNTWGGSPIQTTNNNTYMLATILGKGYPGLVWCNQATIGIAKPQDMNQVAGPYEYVTSLINSSTVNCTGVINPVIVSLNNNDGYLLYYTCAYCHNDTNDTQNCENPQFCSNTLRVSFTNNPNLEDTQSWMHKNYPLFTPNANSWEDGIADNPGPVVLNNNTILLSFRAGGGHVIGLKYSNGNWSNHPYVNVNNGSMLFANDSRYRSLEDPFVWQTDRGYHMLLHYMGHNTTNVGAYAWSKDGINWKLNGNNGYAYNQTIYFTDGTNIVCGSREEPKLLIQKNKPTYLANVCQKPNGGLYVSMVPIKQ